MIYDNLKHPGMVWYQFTQKLFYNLHKNSSRIDLLRGNYFQSVYVSSERTCVDLILKYIFHTV